MTPNTTLETVEDYITDARTLLQDTLVAYRYDDPSLLVAFNVTLLETRRLRPDLFIHCNGVVPSFGAISDTRVYIEPPFRLAVVFGIVAHALARDQEDFQDARASTFMGVFNDMLMGLAIRPIGGGSPPGGK